jgi:hypothetical protein
MIAMLAVATWFLWGNLSGACFFRYTCRIVLLILFRHLLYGVFGAFSFCYFGRIVDLFFVRDRFFGANILLCLGLVRDSLYQLASNPTFSSPPVLTNPSSTVCSLWSFSEGISVGIILSSNSPPRRSYCTSKAIDHSKVPISCNSS